jgi:hypothetical protein
MTKEYYTPTIEEFHIGFEYEWLDENKMWIKSFCPEEISVEGFDEQTYGLRVKYLDREDIESLGFNTEDNGECYNKTNAFDIYGLYPWEWNKGIQNQYKIILNGDTLFLGIIKNKSELKVLLKQLNIHE